MNLSVFLFVTDMYFSLSYIHVILHVGPGSEIRYQVVTWDTCILTQGVNWHTWSHLLVIRSPRTNINARCIFLPLKPGIPNWIGFPKLIRCYMDEAFLSLQAHSTLRRRYQLTAASLLSASLQMSRPWVDPWHEVLSDIKEKA